MLHIKKKLIRKSKMSLDDLLRRFKFSKRRFQQETRVCKLYIRRSFTNLFFTVTDLNDKVVFTMTTGHFAINNTSKSKLSPITLDFILYELKSKLLLYKLSNIEIILRSRLLWQFKTITRYLLQHGIVISSIITNRINAHNGVRSRRQRKR